MGEPTQSRRLSHGRFWLVVWVVTVAVVGMSYVGLEHFQSSDDSQRFCTAEALMTPEGNLARSGRHDCLFVDSNGDVYTASDGSVLN